MFFKICQHFCGKLPIGASLLEWVLRNEVVKEKVEARLELEKRRTVESNGYFSMGIDRSHECLTDQLFVSAWYAKQIFTRNTLGEELCGAFRISRGKDHDHTGISLGDVECVSDKGWHEQTFPHTDAVGAAVYLGAQLARERIDQLKGLMKMGRVVRIVIDECIVDVSRRIPGLVCNHP